MTKNILPEDVKDTDVIIPTPSGKFTEFGNRIFSWCNEHNIEIDFVARWTDNNNFLVSAWRIKNTKHRTLFTLRWA